MTALAKGRFLALGLVPHEWDFFFSPATSSLCEHKAPSNKLSSQVFL